MKTLDEVKQAKKDFSKEFAAAFTAVGNDLGVGIGKDPATGEYTIAVRLTNDKLKNILPKSYQGFQVDTIVIGTIKAL